MERLKGMSAFAKVVELGSFTAAAQPLQLSVSAGSQIVARRAAERQAKLLDRRTRRIGPAEGGKSHF